MAIRVFVVEAFKIPSGSMVPSLLIGDYILVNKFIYYFTEPQRGDIIVFKFPQDPRRDFIKRIIGLPGDTVEIRSKRVFINHRPLEEDYTYIESHVIHAGDVSNRDNFGPLIVPAGFYFMMGDNRDNSFDSRFWGPLDHQAILGKAFLVYWSWNAQGWGQGWGQSWGQRLGLSAVRWRRVGRRLGN